MVAPQLEWSGCGHWVTTTKPIPVQRRLDTEYAIAGTPADCTRQLKILKILADRYRNRRNDLA